MKSILQTVLSQRNPEAAEHSARFFKTDPGQYGEGDKFLGITVPKLRKIAKQFPNLELTEIEKLLQNPWHEVRLSGLYVLVNQFQKGDKKTKKLIYTFYLKHRASVNNWDLVDTSAPRIVGEYLLKNPDEKKILYRLVKSKNIWERRIAIVATLSFIRKNEFTDILALSKLLFNDTHDLLHKAVGWMLREAGKRDVSVLKKFLKEYASMMPRTALRYAIEKFSPEERKKYLIQRS